MRSLFIIAALFAAVSVSRGELQQEVLSVVATNLSETFTSSKVIVGEIDTIFVDVVTAGSTGTLTVAASPWFSTISDVTLVDSSAHATDTTYRPRFDGTGTDGSALTSDPPGKYASIGNVTLSVTATTITNVIYRAVVIYKK